MARRVSMGRRRIVTCCEQDAFTRAKKFYCYLARPGVSASIKARANRRDRRTVNVWDGWE